MSAEDRLFEAAPFVGAPAYLTRAREVAGQVGPGARAPEMIRVAGVLGAGTMGRGIALGLAQTGRAVVLVDPSSQALETARGHITALVDRSLAKGRIDEGEHSALLARITYHTDLAAFSGADLVVEAVPEEMGLKQKVLAQIEAVVGEGALITSNTSTLDVDQIASALTDPARFIGTHFFLPAQVNPLLEVVPAAATAPETTATIMALAADLGKNAVIAANGDGFIGNRLFDRFHQEAMYLVEEGALPEEVDEALERWGMAIGPFRALDMIGNDIPWGVRKQRSGRPKPPPQPRIGDALCEAGLYGQKVGRGWYLYDEVTPKGRPYEEVRVLVQKISTDLGYTRRRIDPGEIVGRCLTALILEGHAMLAEGRAARASDIDMVYVTGYGFPAAFGGPMRLGDEVGLAALLSAAKHYGDVSGRVGSAWDITHLTSKETVS